MIQLKKEDERDWLARFSNVVSALSVALLLFLALTTSCSKDQQINKATLRTVLRLICATACESAAREKCECEDRLKSDRSF